MWTWIRLFESSHTKRHDEPSGEGLYGWTLGEGLGDEVPCEGLGDEVACEGLGDDVAKLTGIL